MNVFVVDASVAAKWFLPDEPLGAQALHLFDRYAQGDVRFLVPDLFWAELSNIFWKSVRLRRIRIRSAQSALASLRDRRIPTFPSLDLLDSAFRIAATFDRTVYDALYVALALHSKSQLVTADEKLAHSLAPHLPVRSLLSL